MGSEPRIGPPRCTRCGEIMADYLTCPACGPRLAYRDESSAAVVVTKRIDRADGASELSFYAIGPKRNRHADAVADLGRLSADPAPPVVEAPHD